MSSKKNPLTIPKEINVESEITQCIEQIKVLCDLIKPCIENDPKECISIAVDIQIFAELIKRYNQ